MGIVLNARFVARRAATEIGKWGAFASRTAAPIELEWALREHVLTVQSCTETKRALFQYEEGTRLMARDIDYAATAVKAAIVEKFGRKSELQDLDVTAGERTISIQHDGRTAEGTRDDLLAAVRAADSYESLWEWLPVQGKSPR